MLRPSDDVAAGGAGGVGARLLKNGCSSHAAVAVPGRAPPEAAEPRQPPSARAARAAAAAAAAARFASAYSASQAADEPPPEPLPPLLRFGPLPLAGGGGGGGVCVGDPSSSRSDDQPALSRVSTEAVETLLASRCGSLETGDARGGGAGRSAASTASSSSSIADEACALSGCDDAE